jgi:hypothetical protein
LRSLKSVCLKAADVSDRGTTQETCSHAPCAAPGLLGTRSCGLLPSRRYLHRLSLPPGGKRRRLRSFQQVNPDIVRPPPILQFLVRVPGESMCRVPSRLWCISDCPPLQWSCCASQVRLVWSASSLPGLCWRLCAREPWSSCKVVDQLSSCAPTQVENDCPGRKFALHQRRQRSPVSTSRSLRCRGATWSSRATVGSWSSRPRA